MTATAPYAPAGLEDMKNASTRACNLLKILSNPGRLMLLCQLMTGEYCVGELESATAIHQPTLSQQLTVLREENLVTTRRDGKQVFYRICSPEARTLIETLHGLFCEAAQGAR